MSESDPPPQHAVEEAVNVPFREPTILFHVGAVPTATGLIQRSLERHGERWNEIHVGSVPGAVLDVGVASGSTSAADAERFAAAMDELVADQRTQVVAGARGLLGHAFDGPPGSGLHANSNEAIAWLERATRSYRRVIVLSISPQAELLEWHYARAIKSGSTATLDEWLAGIDLDNLSWLPVYERLVEAFGIEAVVPCRFSKPTERHTRFLAEFFAAAGLILPETVARKTARPALRLSETGVRLAIAAHPHLVSAGQRSNLHAFLGRNFSELDGTPGTVLPPPVASLVNARYDDELPLLLTPKSATQTAGSTL